MKLTEIKGNLFDNTSSDTVYAHCIAQDDNYGAGIAPVFVKYFGIKYKLSLELKESSLKGMIGNVGFCIMINNTANLITKSHTHGKPTYNSITNALIDMKYQMLAKRYKKLCIPKIGCGLDRLSWGKVCEIISNIFADTDIDIVVKHL
jgi:hypothetical protein